MRWSRESNLIMITSAPNSCWTLPFLERTTLQWNRQWKMPMVSSGRLVPELPYLLNPWKTLIPSKCAYSSSRPSSLYSSNETPTHGFSHMMSVRRLRRLITWAKIICFCVWIETWKLSCGVHLFIGLYNVIFWGEKFFFKLSLRNDWVPSQKDSSSFLLRPSLLSHIYHFHCLIGFSAVEPFLFLSRSHGGEHWISKYDLLLSQNTSPAARHRPLILSRCWEVLTSRCGVYLWL